jgi:hypothetical protein
MQRSTLLSSTILFGCVWHLKERVQLPLKISPLFEGEEQNLGGRRGQEGLEQDPGAPLFGEEEGPSSALPLEITPFLFLRK